MPTVTIRSGDSAALANPALLPMVLGCSRGGTVGQVYTFDPGNDVVGTLRGGTGCDFVLALLRESQGRVFYMPCTPTWTPAPSIAHVGTGPTVSCALTAGEPGCFDDYTIRMTVRQGGAGGEGASMDVAYDGATNVETLLIPAENAATLRGKVDITRGAVLNGLTLPFTAPAAKTLTFPTGTLTASAAGLQAATATVAAIVTITANSLTAAGVALVNAANGAPLTFTTAGVTPANAPANIALEGNDENGNFVSETLVLSQIAGVVTSVHRYQLDATFRGVFPAADGVAATIAIGYADTYGTAQSIVDAFNAQAASAPLAMSARVASTASAQYLEVYSTAAGSGVSATIDGAGTACAALGFTASAPSNLTADGSAATVSIPFTGLTYTFPVGVYVVGDTYTATCVGPRASVQALANGATAARNNYRNAKFGFLVVAQPAPDALTCAATEVALASLTSTWSADPTNAIFVTPVVGAPFFAASPVTATNNAAILAADGALLAACAATGANFGNIATCDAYIPGSTSLHAGSIRRTATLSWAAKHAASAKLAADVGDGLIPEATLLGPDLLTLARDESTATTKLGGGGGPGFSAIGSTLDGYGYAQFFPGATRAGNTSRLRYIGPLTVALSIAFYVYPFVSRWRGQTDQVDPVTNQLTAKAKKKREEDIRSLLLPVLLPADSDPNISGQPLIQVLNPVSGTFLDNGQVFVRISFKPLGEIEDVIVDIVATGANITG